MITNTETQTVFIINDLEGDWMISFDAEGIIWNGHHGEIIRNWHAAGINLDVVNGDFSTLFPLGKSYYANLTYSEAKDIYNRLLDNFLDEIITDSLNRDPDFLTRVRDAVAEREAKRS